MRNWWIKFGCFLIGYNYTIVASSSEVAAKMVKRYTSAILIVCILWSFIGFMFTKRYLYGTLTDSIAGSAIMIIIVIQIERQIILSIDPSKWLYIVRGVIAILMAIIGSIIIDQIMFKGDIELEKINFTEKRIQKALPGKTGQLLSQIAALDTAIQKKDGERIKTIDEVGKTPIIKSTTTQSVPTKVSSTSTDSLGKIITSERIVNTMSVITTNVPNPKQALIAPLEQELVDFRLQKSEKENALLNIRPQLEQEIKSKVGFLDELEIMSSIITGSGIALFVWLIWIFFLLGLETLVLISKISEKENDYEETIKHQMNFQMKKLAALAKT